MVAKPAWSDLPLITQSAVLNPTGVLTVDLGVGYRDEPRDFGLPERDSQWEIGKTRLTLGLGERVEVQATGVVFAGQETGDDSEWEFGDWTLGTKVQLLGEAARRPAIALLWEVKLPVASNEKGIGTDETDFLAHVLVSRRVGERHRVHGNVGVGLLGDPTENSAQDDVAILRAAWTTRLTDRQRIGAELLARDGFKENDSPILLRGSYRSGIGRWSIAAGIAFGLNDEADNMAIDLFLRRDFRWWNPDR